MRTSPWTLALFLVCASLPFGHDVVHADLYTVVTSGQFQNISPDTAVFTSVPVFGGYYLSSGVPVDGSPPTTFTFTTSGAQNIVIGPNDTYSNEFAVGRLAIVNGQTNIDTSVVSFDIQLNSTISSLLNPSTALSIDPLIRNVEIFTTPNNINDPLGSADRYTISGLSNLLVIPEFGIPPGSDGTGYADIMARLMRVPSVTPLALNTFAPAATNAADPQFALVLTSFANPGGGATLEMPAVPEPSSWVLIAVGLIGWGIRKLPNVS